MDQRTEIGFIGLGQMGNPMTVNLPNEVLTRRFQVEFANKLLHKDVTLCIEEGASMGIPMPVSVAIREMLAFTSATFGNNADISNVARVLEQWAGITIEDKAPL